MMDMAMKMMKVVDNQSKIDILSTMNTKKPNSEADIQPVMVKYIKGGKDIVMYNPKNGKCWVERTVGEITTTIKEYCIIQ